MNESLIARLEALEAQEQPPWRFVIRADDESEEAAKAREGVKAGEHVIVVSRLDEAL